MTAGEGDYMDIVVGFYGSSCIFKVNFQLFYFGNGFSVEVMYTKNRATAERTITNLNPLLLTLSNKSNVDLDAFLYKIAP
jgi:hypothetical protein